MGQCFKTMILDGKLSEVELIDTFDLVINNLLQSDGDDPYNGTFTTCSGLTVHEIRFENQKQAQAWLSEHTEKGGNVVAVRFQEVESRIIREPTFGGVTKSNFQDPAFDFLYAVEVTLEDQWGSQQTSVIRCCLTNAFSGGVGISKTYAVHPADQLTTRQQSQLVSNVKKYIEARFQYVRMNVNFKAEIADIQDLRKDIPWHLWSEIRRLRKDLLTNLNRRERLAYKLTASDAYYDDKLWETAQDNGKWQWMLGGMCSM